MADVNRATSWPLPLLTRVHILLRSLLLQASWNFERLQNVGFLFVILPGLRRLYPQQELRGACARHLEYFNSHPFLVPTILGASLHLEAETLGKNTQGDDVGEFKKMVMAPYAAMGDAFFWGGLRPLAAGVALFFAFRGSLWAPLIFLILFNVPHLLFRIMGFRRGLSLGLGVIHVIQAHRLPDLAMKAKEASVIVLGGLAAVLALDLVEGEGLGGYWGFFALPLLLAAVWLLRQRISPLVLIYGAISGLVLVGMFM